MSTALENKQTEGFIDENPIMVQFRRYETVETNEGGVLRSSTPTLLPPQKARLVQSSLVRSNDARTIPDGRIVNVEATLVMLVGSDVQEGDEVTIPAHGVGADEKLAGDWKVIELSGRWATNAGLMRYGS